MKSGGKISELWPIDERGHLETDDARSRELMMAADVAFLLKC